jgi:prophage regulatory protein
MFNDNRSTIAEDRFLRLTDLRHLTGLGRSQTYALIHAGKFPSPIKLSERCSAWREIEVRQWMDARVAARDRRAEAVAA